MIRSTFASRKRAVTGAEATSGGELPRYYRFDILYSFSILVMPSFDHLDNLHPHLTVQKHLSASIVSRAHYKMQSLLKFRESFPYSNLNLISTLVVIFLLVD
jgi:hypothetical protein